MKLSDWPVGLIVISSVLIARTSGDFSSGANQAVRCMLSHSSPEDCASLPKVIVPSYLLEVFNDSPSSLHESLHKDNLIQLSENQIANIPLSLLYLIPRARLADLDGNQLRAILQKHADDKSLVHQVAACLHQRNKVFKLIEKVKNISLPAESQQILAELVETTDLTKSFLKLPYFERESFLAYLCPAVLFNVETGILYSILFLLQMTAPSDPPNKPAIYFLNEAAIRHQLSIPKFKGFELGLSPDQLLNESLYFENSVNSFRLDLSVLQARALFERTYHKASLGSSDFIDSKPILFKLSPALLQTFPLNVQKYEVNYIDQAVPIPLPTACQITAYVKADCITTRRLPKDEETFWDINIRHLGKWVYTLPLSALEDYKTTVLSTAVLKTLESPLISPLQAYYLSGKGEALDVMTPNSVLELETFLHALPASQLVNRKLGEISSHVLLHLVSKLPANNLALSLSLVTKIASSIGDTADEIGADSSALEELLGNRDVNQIIALLSPKDLALSAEAILHFFNENRIRISYGKTIEQLPQQVLVTLLEHNRLKNSSQWRWSNVLKSSQVSHLLVGGLTCQDIEDMDTGLFVPIMSRYNSVRNKTFPKNLQHCCLKKLISHLKLKMTLSQTDPDLGLISLLEPIEIESIKGFVLVNLPLDAMEVSPYLGHILSSIGRLSNADLMLSADIKRLKLIAELAIDKEGNVNTFIIRNLIWFLPPNASTPELKLMLEARLLDTTLCLPTEDRRHIATRLMAEFGPPESWSEGVLATLQDLLIVFSDEELSKVSQSSWTKAADSFKSHYNDFVDWIKPSTFYKVCSNILGELEENDYKNGIGRYIRWRLKAAQWLLDTVVLVSQAEDSKQNLTYIQNNLFNQDEESKTHLSIFDPVEEPMTEGADVSEYEDSDYDKMESNEITSTTIKYENPTDESTTEKSTTEESTTEESTTEESATEESTTEEKTTLSTTEEITTDKSTTKISLTEKATAESTTKEITTESPIIEETTTDKSMTKNSFIEKITESMAEEDLSTEKSINHKSVSVFESSISQSENSQENTHRNITGEHLSQTTDHINLTLSNSTTKKPAIFNISSTSMTNNDISRERNFTAGISKSSDENSTDIEHLKPCTNSSNNRNCTQTNWLKTNSTKNSISPTHQDINEENLPTQTSVKNLTTSGTDASIDLAFNETSSFSSKNQSDHFNHQNSTTVQSKTSLNQSEDHTMATSKVQSETVNVSPSASENKYYASTEKHIYQKIPNNEIYTTTPHNNTENITSSEKTHTLVEDSQNNNIDDTSTANLQPSPDHDYEDEEIEMPDNAIEQTGILYLRNSAARRERSVFIMPSNDVKLSCNAIKMVGSLVEVALTTSDLEEMSAVDIADCRVEFGAMELNEALQKQIWKRIKSDLKLDGIHLLGRLLRVATAPDLWDIKFRASDPWILETISAFVRYNNNTTVMKKLMEDVVKKNAELSVDLISTLGPAVCSLHPDKLRALSVVGLDLGPSCPPCLPYLAMRASEELGSVDSWTFHFVHSLQAIVAGLDLENWKQLAASYHKPLTALQPSAAKCLNTSHLEVLSPAQIRMIPAVTLLSLSEEQLAALNSNQLEAVKNITQPTVETKMTPTKRVNVAGFPRGNSNQMVPTVLLVTFLSIFYFLEYS